MKIYMEGLTEKQIARIERIRAQRAKSAPRIRPDPPSTGRFGLGKLTAENIIDALVNNDSARADSLFEALSRSNRARADAKYLKQVEKLKKLGNIEAVKKWVELFVKNLDEQNIDDTDIGDALNSFNGFQLLPYSPTRLKSKNIGGYEFIRYIEKYRKNPDSVQFEDFPIDLAIDIIEDDYWRKALRRWDDLKDEYSKTLKQRKNGGLTEKSYQLLSQASNRLLEQAKNEIYPEVMK